MGIRAASFVTIGCVVALVAGAWKFGLLSNSRLTAGGNATAHSDEHHDGHDHDHSPGDHSLGDGAHGSKEPDSSGLPPAPLDQDGNARPGDADSGHRHGAGDHAGHDHAGHDDATAIELSPQARKNIGLKTEVVTLRSFTRTIEVPGIVEERPGRSILEVTAPMTGIITHIYPLEGEAVEPGQKLFELRMTHEELVQSQAELLQTVEEIAVTNREIERIESLTANGGVAGKQLLERKYDLQKLEAILRSKKQALRLHGLSETQVESIVTERELLKDLTVFAPTPTDTTGDSRPVVFQIQSLRTAQGRHVEAGAALAVLAEHSSLYLRGEAFESDIAAVSKVADSQLPLTALLEGEVGRREVVSDLRVLYLAGSFSPNSRTLDFFVKLPNSMTRDVKLPDGHRFVSWRFRPGQRLQLQIPVETWTDRIVLPLDAVAHEGAEAYVFVANGDHFDRRSVHVEYRDSQTVVIARDGSLEPGTTVAMNSAQQLHLALKNRSGAGMDPHAGHNH